MDKRLLLTVNNVAVYHFPGASPFFFKSGLEIDADGSPHAYGPNGKGLDHLANAGHQGNWWALVTDIGEKTGTPLVQGPNDPAPGFYISTTALQDPALLAIPGGTWIQKQSPTLFCQAVAATISR